MGVYILRLVCLVGCIYRYRHQELRHVASCLVYPTDPHFYVVQAVSKLFLFCFVSIFPCCYGFISCCYCCCHTFILFNIHHTLLSYWFLYPLYSCIPIALVLTWLAFSYYPYALCPYSPILFLPLYSSYPYTLLTLPTLSPPLFATRLI